MSRSNPDIGVRIINPRNDPKSALFAISHSEWNSFVNACKSAPNAIGSFVTLYSGIFQEGFPASNGRRVKLSSYGIGIEHLDWKEKQNPRDRRNWFAFWENDKDRDDFLALLDQVTVVREARDNN